MRRVVGYLALVALGCSGAISAPLAAQRAGGPEVPPFDEFGRANEAARTCQNAAEFFGREFSVGTCLALLRENATNEAATICAHLKQVGLLPFVPEEEEEEGEPIETVADCIKAVRDF